MTVVITTVMTITYGFDNDDSGIKEEKNDNHDGKHTYGALMILAV